MAGVLPISLSLASPSTTPAARRSASQEDACAVASVGCRIAPLNAASQPRRNQGGASMTATLGACSGPRIALLAAALLLPVRPAAAQLMVVGNDEKVWFDDAGKQLNQAPGKDAIALYDLRASAAAPKRP